MKLKNVIVLLGPPGSGKGTQADLLSEKFGYLHFGMGPVIREYIKNNPDDKAVKDRYDMGILQPDDLMLDWFQKKMSELIETQSGLILDAFPMSLKQADALENILKKLSIVPKVFYINISPQTVQSRLAVRKICQGCKTPYVKGQEDYTANQCRLCGGRMEVRSDDKPEVIANRIAEYEERMGPIKEYYQKLGLIHIIDGERQVSEVHKELMSLTS
jgi:adenylate kinase